MTTSFSSLPLVDLSPLSSSLPPSDPSLVRLGQHLHDVFSTTGFAYLTNHPLSFPQDEIFNMARAFFSLSRDQKMNLAKKAFRPDNHNTYRGYFPVQLDLTPDNLKEGFEIGPPTPLRTSQPAKNQKTDFTEPNVWPSQQEEHFFPFRASLEKLYIELQSLSSTLLSLLARSLGQEPSFFDSYLTGSVSTLRLLHYPPLAKVDRATDVGDGSGTGGEEEIKLSCPPHTDSGILTLLHQDATGGLEVQNARGEWVAAPYIPDSIVVNIGDLMARVSGGAFVATMHRVRMPVCSSVSPGSSPSGRESGCDGRISVPFFFEPGEDSLIRSIDGQGGEMRYGDHVRAKMKTWVEFRDYSH